MLLDHIPSDKRSEFHHFVAQVGHVDQTRPQHVVLFGRAGKVLHAADRICRVSTAIMGKPAADSEVRKLKTQK